ncbi:conjugative relaxase domain-containing protein, TrwC/TraI family [Micromonospora echinofusca]|uniref:Conjugative relaxase domain-containing protein, TrwC/TraI family n=2 Tax=Micromonospora echinofusca TaxID=47858 RepID=A0A1C5G6V8_MICEH|nr:conjugative relaxase domain-containing protein, TrwC/TraI family [Micromonospora echinofusca]
MLIFYGFDMLTITRISPGSGYRYVMEQVAAGRHDLRAPTGDDPTAYYTDPTARGESPGWWAGDGAAVLGVSGWVTEKQMRLLIGEGRHPRVGHQLGQRWRTYAPQTDEYRAAAAQRALDLLPPDATVEQRDKAWYDAMTAPERRAVSGYDVTASPVNSVSLLWAFGDDDVKRDVMAAHHAGVRAVLAHLQRHGAYARAGAGGVRQLDTGGLAAMVFDHRLSRERDPQLHAHIVISAKVLARTHGADPQWLALDGKALYRAAIGARIAYDRAIEAELGKRRGITFAPRSDSGIREIGGISDESLRHYAKRRTAITEHLHHTSNPLQRTSTRRWRARAQHATLRTRRPHKGAESTHEAVRRWLAEDRKAGLDTSGQISRLLAGRAYDSTTDTAARVLRHARRITGSAATVDEATLRAAATQLRVPRAHWPRVLDAAVRADERLAVARAVHTLSRERAVFGPDHLELAIGRTLGIAPGHSPTDDWRRVQQLAATAVTQHTAGLRVLTPPALVQWGPSLRRASDQHSEYTRHRDLHLTTRSVLAAEQHVIAYARRRGARPAPAHAIDAAIAETSLLGEKTDVLRFLIGDDRRVTGVIGPAGSGKTHLQRAVVAAAAHAGVPVLGLTVGQAAANLLADATRRPGGTALRTENIARWLHAQQRPPAGTSARDWQFAPGQWVIIDEASQVSSHDLARLTLQLDQVRGKLILVGDPHQTSAVGPGGLLRYLAALGVTRTLAEVHRFHHPWEGPASLRLRHGDITVLADYDRHRRLIGGHRADLVDQMLTRWLADTTAGRRSLILVDTNDEAADIAHRARTMLIAAGHVQRGPSVRLRDDNIASVGDVIVTRRNDRRIAAGPDYVTNRDQWRIKAISRDSQLHVTNVVTGTTTVLPAAYTARHTHLAYAQTVDSVQGQTVDTARALIDDSTSLERVYVMLTRARTLNEAYVVTDDEPREGTPPAPPTAAVAVLADIMRRTAPERSATETEQQLLADVDALHVWTPIYDDLAARARIPEYLAIVRQLRGPAVADRLARDLALPALITRLTTYAAAGHDPRDVLSRVIRVRELDSADDLAAVLSWRIDRLMQRATADPAVAERPEQWGTHTERLPANVTGDIGDALRQVAAICDRRTDALAHHAAQTRPAWTLALGDVPSDDAGRQQWLTRAEVVGAYRDTYQYTGEHPIGPEPHTSEISRWNAWHRARLVLGAATLAGQLTTAPDTELARLIAAQQTADRAAPAYAGDDLRAAYRALTDAEHHRHDLTQQIATAHTAHQQARVQAQRLQPRWWHHGPARTRRLTAQSDVLAHATTAAQHIGHLQQQLVRLDHQIAGSTRRATALDGQHATWKRWYDGALPTRYAGLAAAAEQARRAASRNTALADAVAATTARVTAVHDTRPAPQSTPVPAQLRAHAHDAQQRIAAEYGSEID